MTAAGLVFDANGTTWVQARDTSDTSGAKQVRQIPAAALRPRTTPFPEGKSTLVVIYGVLLWADMNAATPLGAWGYGGAL